MAVQTTRALSGFARYAWSMLAGVGALFIILAIWPALDSTGMTRGYFLNFILIHVLWVLLAVFGLRRGERWAWYAMALWPLWLILSAYYGALPHG